MAGRYLCAKAHPDHASICAFRVANEAAFKAAFGTVLQLARELRLARVGTVSVDGTKVAANASKPAAVSYQRAGELIRQLELEGQELVTRAQQADTQGPKETLDLPAELARREKRLGSLKQARQVIEARAKRSWPRPKRNPTKPTWLRARPSARRAKSRAAKSRTRRAKCPIPKHNTTLRIRRAGS